MAVCVNDSKEISFIGILNAYVLKIIGVLMFSEIVIIIFWGMNSNIEEIRNSFKRIKIM